MIEHIVWKTNEGIIMSVDASVPRQDNLLFVKVKSSKVSAQ